MRIPAPSRVALLAPALALLFGGCLQLGPKSISRDQFDYSTAVGNAWKEQMLLNIVKLRYVDMPVFVDVSQIVSGYSLETSVDAGASFVGGAGGNVVNLGAGSKFTDRPTLTYTPKTGDRFMKSLLTPIDPSAIFLLVQTGYNARFLFEWSLESMSGLRNRTRNSTAMREADPGFDRMLELVSSIQSQGSVGVRVEADVSNRESTVLFFRRQDQAPEVEAQVSELRQILGLSADGERFRIVFSPARGAADELTVQTRSMLQVLSAMAAWIEAPPEHVKSGRALPGANTQGDPATWPLRIHSSLDAPSSAFASIQYAGHWFWIDNEDLRSKRAFFFVTFLFSLSEPGGKNDAPVLTIPTG